MEELRGRPILRYGQNIWAICALGSKTWIPKNPSFWLPCGAASRVGEGPRLVLTGGGRGQSAEIRVREEAALPAWEGEQALQGGRAP